MSDLASHRHCIERIAANWPGFLEKRKERLVQQERHGVAAEKVAENILEDLFTEVLDWEISDLNNQVGYADLLLSRLDFKYLIVEVKRPGALAWNKRAIEAARDQARRYADEQKVKCVGVSDGLMLYAADVEHGGFHDRVFVSLDSKQLPEDLWWLSVHGIYRRREDAHDAALRLLPEPGHEQAEPVDYVSCDELLHPKYRIPAQCFAFIGDANDPHTWKLPYLNIDGSVDTKRLPKAVQSILSNYRGTKVSGIPESSISDILVRLALAAGTIGKMPHQCGEAAPVYQELLEALDQFGRLNDVIHE